MGLSFPSSLTDEEKLLQHKYAQLKRKKNQINSLKNPKVETPPAPVIPPVIKRPLPSDSGSKADAKEVAKKLLKSGAITAIKVPEKKDTGFVRKRTLSSRVGDKPGGYRPFSASTSVDEEDDVFVSSIPSDPNPAPDYSAKYNSLSSSSYVSPKDAEVIAREETMREKKREGKQHYVNRDLPNQGNTIYIRAPGMTEMSLKRLASYFCSHNMISLDPSLHRLSFRPTEPSVLTERLEPFVWNQRRTVPSLLLKQSRRLIERLIR
jgi:negative elongation factor E